MTPTLFGRIQTRLVLLATIGVIWTIIVVPILPKRGASFGDVYTATFLALLVVGIVGIGWELIYHLIQQFRWEKDWPILLGLLLGIPESIVAFIFVDAIILTGPPALTFFLHFFSTWILIWLFANGPLRIFLLRWRYNGGRIF